MADPGNDQKPPQRRRRRYSGTHPRCFDDKYKELAPDRYPEIVAHVREQGLTPAGQHVPVLVEETLAALAPAPGDRGVDATVGYGGHAERLLERIQPGGRLLALDADPIELPKTEMRLRALGYDHHALTVQRTNFAALGSALDAAGWSDGVDFLFADLGVSSMQIDNPARGFSLKHEGPLDMRMNPNRGVPAGRWLQQASLEALVVALEDHADEPRAHEIATALAARRGALQTTAELAAAVREVVGEDDGLTVRRVFQALRIAVNDELGALAALLRQLPGCLRPGGRIAILTFHSGEDRRVKQALDAGVRAGVYTDVPREVIRAAASEQRANPRAKAAKLRSARRTSMRLEHLDGT